MDLEKLEYIAETDELFHWLQRSLVVRSDALARRHQKSLYQRLDKAEEALSKLVNKRHKDYCTLKNNVQTILNRYRVNRYRVNDYMSTEISTEMVTR
ncbi:MAG: hypothetical protein AAF579_05460 [Cyanobacteria bacterium P01_C01_bin.118]